ncbi:efflux RND transporter permease subunit [Oceanicola sp. S124]|uniref:efflux RND transporter permease subunit n=1 Tax=Oceanicola sp. S124 TaxID=1042378 RepID=UPI0002DF4287
MKKGFNLSDWALNHRSFVWFLMIVSLVAGAVSYVSMGREEDPSFAIKTMVVSAALPGATAEQTVTQVTDRIEKKLQELDNLKNTRSVTYPGQTIVYIDLTDTTRGEAVNATWLKVRNMMSDLQSEMPDEFAGFYFNDDFGDVFGSIYAFTSDGFSPRELEERVDEVRSAVLQLDAAGKVELVGVRDPVVHIEFSSARLAALGLDKQTVMNTLAAQNAIVPSGFIHTGAEQVLVRVTGQFASAEDLAYAPLRAGETFFTLADVAEITSGYEDPPGALFRFGGEEGIALTIGMREGENILDFGEELHALMERVAAELPVGIEMHLVADQPHVVDHSINHFVKALVEAVVIVLAVSFVSLGGAGGAGGLAVDPAGAGDHLRHPRHDGHHLAADLARGADHRARAAGG